jgi:hypothetical protein
MLAENKKDATSSKSEVSISVAKIEEIAFRSDFPDNFSEVFNRAALRISLAHGLKPLPETNRFNVNISALYEFEGKEILEYGVAVSFVIENLPNYLEINDKQFKVNPDFVPVLLNTAIGALRGMISLKTASTVLAGHPLPLIDLGQMLKSGYNVGD